MGVLLGLVGLFIRFTPVKPDLLIKESDRVLDLEVVDTPGHTAGSISLYIPKSAIFVGDAMAVSKAGEPRLPPGAFTVNMDQAKESLKKISGLDYSLLLPGHGPPITKDGSSLLAAYVKNDFV